MEKINLLKKLLCLLLISSTFSLSKAQEIVLSEDFSSITATGWNQSSDISSELNDYTSISGWNGIKVYKAPGCVKLGSNSAKGILTTPSIDLSDPNATYTLSFSACAWKNDSKSIEIVLDDQDPIVIDNLDNSGDYENMLGESSFSLVLTGGTASSKITFQGVKASKARFFLDNIKIIKSNEALQNPECAFTEESVIGNLGQEFVAPKFTTVSDGAITYTSSNADIATVDPSTGKVTLLLEGTTTIKASVAATETYAAGSASYELTVKNPNKIFFENFSNGLGQFANENGLWESGTYKGRDYAVANAYNQGAKEEKLISSVIDLTDVDQAVLTFEHAIGYMESNDPKVDFTLWIKEEGTSEWIQLTIPSYPEALGSWSSFVSSGDIDLKAYCGKKVQIAFQYKSTEEKQSGWEISNVLIEKKSMPTVQISVSAAGYATYFNDQAWIVPEGMEAGIVTGVNGNILSVNWMYASGMVVPANTAVLVKAPAKEYICSVSDDEASAPAGNLLKGTLENAMTEGDNCLFYKLSYDQQGENLGFYWAAENGAAFENQAHKAYLALTQAQAAQINGFLIDLNGGATGVTDIQAENAKADVYTLDGVLVRQQVEAAHALDGLQKGIYIVNGKKIMK